jgi:hypothetical protein
MKKVLEMKGVLVRKWRINKMPYKNRSSSPFGNPEDVYLKLQQIHLILTGNSYPDNIINDDTIQELLVNIENHVGITSSFSVGIFSISEDVRDRLKTLYQRICGTSYSQCSAVPEDLYRILENILFASSIYGHWKLNEGTGIIAIDSSWRSHNGTLINMIPADWIPGKVGSNALTFFAATPKHITLADFANFERTDPFSLECWFKTSVVGGLNHLLSKMENAGNFRGWALRVNSGKVEFVLSSIFGGVGQSMLRMRTVNDFNDGIWHHAIITYDGSSLATGVRVYIDNISRALVTVVDNLLSTIINATNLNFAARTGGAYAYSGELDEIVIWAKELTQEEVTYRYNNGTGRETFEIN